MLLDFIGLRHPGISQALAQSDCVGLSMEGQATGDGEAG